MEGKKIISSENIKPSSPTPDEKRIHKLSLLDQQAVPLYGPLISYYPNLEESNSNSNEFLITETLKQSLSATLTSFYPLAGRVLAKDSLFIDCNDQGVLFVVAKFDYKLSDFLKKPDPQAFSGYIPSHSMIAEPGPESYMAMVQVNFFDCGGIAIGLVFSHVAADALTIATFMKAWAAANASGLPPPPPDYTAKSLFPSNESVREMKSTFSSAVLRCVQLGKIKTRRYVFDESGISKIRSQLTVSSSEQQRRPSRFETVSAVIWKCFMDAAAAAAANNKSNNNIGDDNSLYALDVSVNLRRKADPPFLENSFGNFVWGAVAASSTNDSQTGCPDQLKHLFRLIRTALDKVDANLIKQMEGEKGFPGYCKNVEETLSWRPADAADYLFISSYCNFGLYTMDFGWGKPMWVTRSDAGTGDTESAIINNAWVMDTREGHGIEVWLNMEQRYFAELDKMDHELLHLASLDPSPFNITIPN